MKGLAPPRRKSKACFNRVMSQFEGNCPDSVQPHADQGQLPAMPAGRDQEIRGLDSPRTAYRVVDDFEFA